jgi:radical SAM superfamily enzyme YgiQ (UPF0313 family)
MNSKKKILLVNLPFYRLMGSHYNGINMGLCHISSVLNEAGNTCKIYNADYLDSENYADQVRLFEGTPMVKKIHQDADHPIWIETVDNILKFDPDYVGFSVYSADYPVARIVSAHLKKRKHEIKILVGGPHITVGKKVPLEETPDFDYGIIGEGEYSARDLMQGRDVSEIPGLIWRDGEKIVANLPVTPITDLDDLPFPDRSNFYPEGRKYNSHFMLTSRGCPNDCTFCASPRIWDRKVRFRSIGNVIKELKELVSGGKQFVQFQDDTFTFSKKRVMEFTSRVISEGIKFEWICDTRLNCVDEEILVAMKNAGCIRVKVGIESGSRKILKQINKQITPEMALEKTALIRKIYLQFTAYYMIGFPDESNEDAHETIELAKKIGADYNSLSIVSPYYGTAIYNDFIAKNDSSTLKDHWEYFFHQSKEMVLTTKIDEKTVNEFLELNNYSKGKRV